MAIPNVGKSTLFNTLTGARQHTVNAPGTTVELVRGRWKTPVGEFEVTDLPGTYSLIARSPDELVVADALTEAEPDTVAIVLVDATSPARSLYLLAQVADGGTPIVVALIMNDLAAGHGHTVDPDDLGIKLGVPVVEIDTRHHKGIDALAEAVLAVQKTRPSLRGLTPEGHGRRARFDEEPRDETLRSTERLFDWVGETVASIEAAPRSRRTFSDPIDRILLSSGNGHPHLPWCHLGALRTRNTCNRSPHPVGDRFLQWAGSLGGVVVA